MIHQRKPRDQASSFLVGAAAYQKVADSGPYESEDG